MQQQIAEADIVLIVCTPAYRKRFEGLEEVGKGRGATFEGYIVLQELHDSSMLNKKFIPVLLPGATSDDIPIALRGVAYYAIPDSYSTLQSRLFDLTKVSPQPLGLEVGVGWSVS
jgi:hypothetical protein